MMKSQPFDPGFAPLVYSFSENIDAFNQVLSNLKSMHQKKFRFQMFEKKIREVVQNNVAFYFGCLMWAKYLKETFAQNEVEILGNSFYGVDLEVKGISQQDITSEIDYILSYMDKFEKDYKFYLSKNIEFPELWRRILFLYREFLIDNKTFVNTKFTSDILLPEKIDSVVSIDADACKSKIDVAISSENIMLLLG